MKRKITIAAVFLLAGAIVNVGVAWLATLASDWDQRLPNDLAQAVRGTFVGQTPAQDVQHDEAVRLVEERLGESVGETASAWGERVHGFAVSSGSLELWVEDRVLSLTIVDAGWPVRAVQGEYVSEPPEGFLPHAATPKPRSLLMLFGNAVPTRPFWPGFLVNTLFYAALLWLLIRGPFVLRRVIRQRRGRCVACGYDLGHARHDACPECGS